MWCRVHSCVCVCVCVCVCESLPPASNIAVLFCPVASELISYSALCVLGVCLLQWFSLKRVLHSLQVLFLGVTCHTGNWCHRAAFHREWAGEFICSPELKVCWSRWTACQTVWKKPWKLLWSTANPVTGTGILSERVFSATGDAMSSLNTLIGWCFLRKIRNREKYQKLFTHSSLTQHRS